MQLAEAIEALIVATEAGGRSARTVGNYRQKLAPLAAFLGDVPAEAVTVQDLRRFVVQLRSRTTRFEAHDHRPEIPGGLAAASLAGYVRAIKRLFSFLHDDGIIQSNPAHKLQMPKVGRGEPKANDPAEFPKLLAATEGAEPVKVRNRAILLFLADTGCRVGGLAGLRLGDVDLVRRLAKLTEKGVKIRLAPFSEPTGAALATWLTVRPACGHDFVFNHPKAPHGCLTVEGVKQMLRRLKADSGAKGPCNAHSFRHGFARMYLQAGGDLATLADLLGHSSVNVTWQFYAIFRTAELQAMHEKFSPIAKMGREGEL